MLFWLNFIASLPLSPASTGVTQLSNIGENSSTSLNLVAEKPVTTPSYVAQFPQPTLTQIGGSLIFPGIIGSLGLLLLLSVFAYTRIYVITPTNEAFVRTGGVFVKKKTVFLNGGCVVVPGFHELTRVPLREISINVERRQSVSTFPQINYR